MMAQTYRAVLRAIVSTGSTPRRGGRLRQQKKMSLGDGIIAATALAMAAPS